MMLTTPAASQNKAFPLAGIPNRLSLSESHTKHRISPSLPVRRNLLIKLNCAEMELANSLILAQTCRAGSRVNKDEQYSGSAEHKHCLGSVVIRNGCNNENQQVTGKEKGGTENTALWGYGFFHHELNQHLAARQDLQLVRNYSQNPHMLNDYSNLSYEENQQPPTLDDGTNQSFCSMPKILSHVGRNISFSPFPHSASEGAQERINKNITNMINPAQINFFIIIYSLSSSLAFLRLRRLISPCKAATTNCEVLSPSSFTNSTSSITSCGTLACIFCDLALTLPVAITEPSIIWWNTVYTKNKLIKWLKWNTDDAYSVFHLGALNAQEITKPGSALTLTGPLTTNDSLNIEVAMLNHTPTRFKFLFLAVHRSDLNAKPHRESVTAHSEQDARRSLAGQFVLSFAGRLPEVNHA